MYNISIDLARAAVDKHAHDNDFNVVYADDPRRDAVIYAMSAIHKMLGTGWSLEHALAGVSVTLPGAGVAELLLNEIPVVGQILHFFAKDLSKTTVFYSPYAMRTGNNLIATHMHEIGHVGSIKKGGLLWCACYGLTEVVRASEGQCYGAGMAIDHAFSGKPVAQAEADAGESLKGYGLSAKELAFGKAMVHSNAISLLKGGDPGGVIADAKAMLRSVGWTG